MLGIKAKINMAFLTVIFLASTGIVVFSYIMSSKELSEQALMRLTTSYPLRTALT